MKKIMGQRRPRLWDPTGPIRITVRGLLRITDPDTIMVLRRFREDPEKPDPEMTVVWSGMVQDADPDTLGLNPDALVIGIGVGPEKDTFGDVLFVDYV